MIIDITGAILIPGNFGKDCPGNGENDEYECCCNECDYMLCCLEEHKPTECLSCTDPYCPHSQREAERK